MKEATGDMTMTVVVIVGVVFVLALAKPVWNTIKNKVVGQVNNISYVEVVEEYNI